MNEDATQLSEPTILNLSALASDPNQGKTTQVIVEKQGHTLLIQKKLSATEKPEEEKKWIVIPEQRLLEGYPEYQQGYWRTAEKIISTRDVCKTEMDWQAWHTQLLSSVALRYSLKELQKRPDGVFSFKPRYLSLSKDLKDRIKEQFVGVKRVHLKSRGIRFTNGQNVHYDHHLRMLNEAGQVIQSKYSRQLWQNTDQIEIIASFGQDGDALITSLHRMFQKARLDVGDEFNHICPLEEET